MVKIINVEILAIVYFSRMEFKSRKSRTIVAREIYPVYSIDRFMAFFVYFCFFSGIFCFQIIRFDPRNYCFEIFYEILIFLPYFFEGGGYAGEGWHMTICPRSGLLQLDVVLVFLLLLSSSLTHFSVLLHLLHFYNRVILKKKKILEF